MPYVITEKCLGEQYADCVAVCPVECIHPVEHEGKPFMIIDPEIRIDCSVCLPECPIGAIAYEARHGKAAPRPPNDPPRRAENKLVR